MNRPLRYATFLAGLAALAWVGAGYVGTNPLALVVTGLIGAFYLAGALELRRFQAATSALGRAVDELSAPFADAAGLRAWLERLPTSLRNAVRRRVEGEPGGLPGPVMTPYLGGLLVLLGMLGTFLGMVLTLRGTGTALDSATDLQAVRASLVAPVRGLGLAFGTSIAGVAASATLGLLSALCRRERVQVAQRLDARIATTLRVHSMAHQREESLRIQREQAALMPALVDGLRTMMDLLAAQSEASNARLLASQDSFHGKAEATYAGLASSVDRSLKDSLRESARVAGETIRPVAEATMAGIARETAALRESLAETMRQQLEQLSARFEASTTHAADAWQVALARHEQGSRGLAEEVRASHERFAGTFEQRSAALMDDVARRHAELQAATAAAMSGAAADTSALHARIADRVSTQLDGVASRLDETARHVTAGWSEALAQHEHANDRMATRTHDALAAAAAGFEQHSAALLRTVEQAHAELEAAAAQREQQRTAAFTHSIEAMAASLQREWRQAGEQSLAHHVAAAERDEQRTAAFTQSVEAMAASLQHEWRDAGEQTLAQQQRLAETMERTARDITTQAEANATRTAAEIAQLLQAASQAPRAAAEVIAELRDKLSDSMARDNALLDERARMLETLGTLLDAVNQAATEQRGAIDALVGSSATLLDRVGARFAEQVDAEAGKLAEVAAQVTGSAVEVASLGESFGFAVQLFTQSNDKLAAQLQRIDGALGKSLARSDEQLAYYVAQAREVIDLSVMSQKQIIEDLQRLSGRAVAEGAAS